MPVSVLDVDNGRGNVITISGAASRQELLSALGTHLCQDAGKFGRYRYSLMDLTGATELDADVETVRRIAAWSRDAVDSNPDAVVAVAASTDLAFGLTRMWQLQMGEPVWDMAILPSRSEAEAWIRDKVQDRFEMADPTFA